MRALEGLSHLVILDEVQRQPELFEVLRVLVDPGRQDYPLDEKISVLSIDSIPSLAATLRAAR
jgi:predicted AAA+ superfamily ATPase